MPKSTPPPAPTAEASDIFSRLRSCSRELYALDRRPLADSSFVFPWEEFAESIKGIFGVACSFRPQPPAWTAQEAVTQGLVSPTVPISIALTGVEGQATLLVSRSDIEQFMEEALKVDPATLLRQDPKFLDQFSLFLSAQLVACASSIPSLQPLSIRLAAIPPEESVGSLCMDIEVLFEKGKGLARLILPPAFLDSWKALRLGAAPEGRLSEYAEVETPICIEAGRTALSPEELSSIQNGDFLVLDHPFYIPDSQKSRVFLTLHGKALFRAKVQDGSIKILEMPLQHEAFLSVGGMSMAAKQPVPQEDEETPPPEGQGETAPDWEEEQSEPSAPMTEKEAQILSTTLIKEPVDIGQLPLTVVVELAQIVMSVGKLAELQPGNLLDLDIRPENGVSLVVNGKVIGKGDLLRIGDSVGVRITEIGFTKPREN